MGFLKKITRPISKVLDKIVPNEIKPALPFLAAAAPFMLPAGFGIGSLSPMVSRALAAGAANLGSQLAQEGSEGDFSGASLALAAGIGALSTPGAGESLRGARFGEKGTGFIQRSPMGPANIPYESSFIDQSGITGLQKAANIGLEGLAKGADTISGLSEGLATDGLFSKAGAKAAMIPITQGTTDLAIAENRRLEKQLAIEEALKAAEGLADDAASASAIRNAMIAYGFFTDEEIADTIASAGYRAGGRVGLKGGGSDFGDRELKNLKAVEAMEDKFSFDLDDLKDEGFERELDTVLVMIEGPNGVEIKEVLKSEALRDNLKIVSNTGEFPEGRKAGGRVALEKGGGPDFGGILAAIKNIEKGGEGEEMITIMTEQGPVQVKKSVYESMPSMFVDTTTSAYGDAAVGRPVPEFAQGGLMDLGGKEMDLRKGGFVPIGKKERADDVPARLSKNEFVMTADAVRGAGGGDINKGAKRMYETMNKLEARA